MNLLIHDNRSQRFLYVTSFDWSYIKKRMKIYVISLPEATCRRALIAQQMAALGLAYSWIDGVKPDFARLDKTGFHHGERLRRYGYPMAQGEIGCFLAHQSAWRLVQKQTEKCLILEDDAVLSGLSPTLLDALQGSPYPMVRLAGLVHKKYKLIAGTVLSKYWGDPAGSAAYVLGPQEATRLLEKSKSFFMAVDDFLEARHLHGVNTYAVLPYPVWQAGADTQIIDRGRPQLSILRRLHRMLVRIPIDINKYFHRLAYYVG